MVVDAAGIIDVVDDDLCCRKGIPPTGNALAESMTQQTAAKRRAVVVVLLLLSFILDKSGMKNTKKRDE